MQSLIPYIGGKHRLVGQIAKHLLATGADVLVDVFGGSGAVMLNAGFEKRIYNDISGDLVCLMRVMAHPVLRQQLFKRLRWTPPSREIFDELRLGFGRNCYSFKYLMPDHIGRAAATFYLHQFSFGGKGRSGGMSVSVGDRPSIKEVGRYNLKLRALAKIGEYMRHTVIEHLDYRECISLYDKINCVLFCDPPYIGTEKYYCHHFSHADHVMLAKYLEMSKAAVVLTYYDEPLIRELYPETGWTWHRIEATKNSQFRGGQKVKMAEFVICKRADFATRVDALSGT
jgi:DNA adenine methylase